MGPHLAHLSMESDLSLSRLPRKVRPHCGNGTALEWQRAVLEFRDVSFRYPNGKEVLRDDSFRSSEGKTYALVGPPAAENDDGFLARRLYDPTQEPCCSTDRDIRLQPAERAEKIGSSCKNPFCSPGLYVKISSMEMRSTSTIPMKSWRLSCNVRI